MSAALTSSYNPEHRPAGVSAATGSNNHSHSSPLAPNVAPSHPYLHSRGGGATVTPAAAFIDTTSFARLSDSDSDSSSSRDSPVTVDYPFGNNATDDASFDMTFRASQSSLSRSQRGGNATNYTNSSRNTLAASTLSERLTMMNIPTQELKGTVYYGWLWKKGSSFKTWKKRFFLLHGRALTYYTQCCVIASDSLGTQCLDMPAKGGLRVACVEMSHETSFGLKVTSSSGRVLHIQAGDAAARRQWLEVLDEAPRKRQMMADSMMRGTTMSEYPLSNRSNAPVSFADTSASSGDIASQPSSLSTMSSHSDEDTGDDSDKRGWLHVRSSVLHTWKKRFVSLADGHVLLTTHKRSKRPHDKAYAVISCAPFSGHAHAFVVRLDRHKELFLAASSEKEAEVWIDAFRSCL